MASRGKASTAYSLMMFLLVSVLSGLLVAGMAVPLIAIGAGTARTAAIGINELPAEFTAPPQAQASRVLLADGTELARFYDENREYVTLDQISDHMQKAQLAIEDHRFFQHGPIDLIGTTRAAISNFVGNSTSGGSTLTQQYVKLVRVQIAQEAGDDEAVAAAREVSIARKIIEMRYAIAVENELTKDEILERYLNIAYYGSGAYGVQAAAMRYFGVNASDLTIAQSAMLAGLVQNPSETDPIQNTYVALDRRNVVLNRIAQLDSEDPGWYRGQDPYSEEELSEAKATGFDRSAVVDLAGGCANSRYPFLCDFVERTLLSDDMSSLGSTREARYNLLRRGGLTIQTLIDPTSQDAAQSSVSAMVGASDPVLAVSVLIDPATGAIISMAQSRPVMGDNSSAGETYYNYAVSNEMGGAEGFQAGSTFKTFTLAAALSQGVPTSTKFVATSRMQFQGQTFRACSGPFTLTESYAPTNVTINGLMDMVQATNWSVNTYFIQLIRDAGICKTVQIAQNVGVEASMNVDGGGNDLIADWHMDYNPSFTLGVTDITPLSMAVAYATFANRGVRCDPIIVTKVTNGNDEELAIPDGNCRQVIEPEVADGVNSLLRGVMTSGTGTSARVPGNWDQAGKTGTTDNSEALWMAGYTTNLAGVTVLAVDKAHSYWGGGYRTVEGIRMPESGTWLTGGSASLLFRQVMAPALANLPVTQFEPYRPTIPLQVDVKSATPTPTPTPTPEKDDDHGRRPTSTSNPAPSPSR